MPLLEGDYTDASPRFLKEWDIQVGPLPTLIIQNKSTKSARQVQQEYSYDDDAQLSSSSSSYCSSDDESDMEEEEEGHEEEPVQVVIVLLHGYGSNTRRSKKFGETILDQCFLPPTSRFLEPCRRVATVRVLIPQAPHPVSDGVYCWWKLPNAGLAATLMLSATQQLELYYPKYHLQACRELFTDYFACVHAAHPGAVFILAGFSQGSLLALDLTLTQNTGRNPDMLIVMSTTLVEKQLWLRYYEENDEQPVLHTTIIQTHGIYDYLFSYVQAKSFYRLLCTLNSGTTQFFPFKGGHDMSLVARKYIASEIQKLVCTTLTQT
jgi:predicted esterase